MTQTPPFHFFWWLWLPLALIVVQAGLEVFLPTNILAALHSEDGPHEFFEFLIIFGAFIVAVKMLLQMDIRAQKWLAAWIALAAVCSLYVAGEEISWGQHFLKWSTPDYWGHINDQQETNLHNTSSWLDQKPRLILMLGVVVGGLIIPLLQKLTPEWLPERFAPIYPPKELAVTAILAVCVKITEKIDESADFVIMERASEVEELYLFYFVLLYLIALRRRIIETRNA